MINLRQEHKNRNIRFFISSTFQDMQGERDRLAKFVFPNLRQLCRERGVELTDIDLRWGITEEQVEHGRVIDVCLREIERCRPYFIGILGHRYGWVPSKEEYAKQRGLLRQFPWIKDDIENGLSITEIEMQYGVLRNPIMDNIAFFYLRDEALTPVNHMEPVGSNNQKKLKLLRDEVLRKVSAIVYNDLDDLDATVVKDFTAFLDREFPAVEQPSCLQYSRQEHADFARTRLQTYVGKDSYYQAIDSYVAGNSPPIVVTGLSGSGKTALLSNWIARFQENNPGTFVLYHFVGASSDSTDHYSLMRRIMEEMHERFSVTEKIPSDQAKLAQVLTRVLASIPNTERWVLVIDALNQLDDKDNALWLGWLPDQIPKNMRVVLSTLSGDTLEVLETRGYEKLEVEPLDLVERRELIRQYLSYFTRELKSELLERIAVDKKSENPLFLRTLLDELQLWGIHEKLEERIDYYVRTTSMGEFFDAVLQRLEEDYDKNRPCMTGEVLALVLAARRGLSESEILEITGIPPIFWSPLYRALENHLVNRNGLLDFSHDFLRQAVEQRYLKSQELRIKVFLRLADYFEVQPISTRNCDELPWLLQQAGERERLRASLLNIDRFQIIHKRSEQDLMRYWVWLGEDREMGRLYKESFDAWSEGLFFRHKSISYVANQLGVFLRIAAQDVYAEPLMRRALEIDEISYGIFHPKVATDLINLASLLRDTNRLKEAEPLMRRAIEIDEHNYGENHPNVAIDLNNLAKLLQATHRLSEAEQLMKRSLKINEKSYRKDHPEVAICLNNLALLLKITNRDSEAELLYRRALEIDEKNYGKDHPSVAIHLSNLALLLQATNRLTEVEHLYRRALEIDEKNYGKDHPNSAIRLNNLAALYQATNRLNEAGLLMRRSLEINEKNYGKDHPEVARSLNNLAGLYQATNHFNEAELLIGRSLEINEKSFGKFHPNVATSLNNMAALYQATNRLNEAELLMRRSLEINEKNYGKDHPKVAKGLNNLALLLKITNRDSEAELLMRQAIEINENSYGKDHPNVEKGLNNLAQLLKDTNRLSEAEPLMRQSLEINEKSYGKDHPEVARSLNNLALLFQVTNRVSEAELLMRQSLEINEKSYGKDHPEVAIGLNNLAQLLKATNRVSDAEPLSQRMMKIVLGFSQSTGYQHPHLQTFIINYAGILIAMGLEKHQVRAKLETLLGQYGMSLDEMFHNMAT